MPPSYPCDIGSFAAELLRRRLPRARVLVRNYVYRFFCFAALLGPACLWACESLFVIFLTTMSSAKFRGKQLFGSVFALVHTLSSRYSHFKKFEILIKSKL